jgi:hypothetical protein
MTPDQAHDFLFSKTGRFVIRAALAGIILGMALNIAFGVLRLHEGTWLCEYLLCKDQPK